MAQTKLRVCICLSVCLSTFPLPSCFLPVRTLKHVFVVVLAKVGGWVGGNGDYRRTAVGRGRVNHSSTHPLHPSNSTCLFRCSTDLWPSVSFGSMWARYLGRIWHRSSHLSPGCTACVQLPGCCGHLLESFNCFIVFALLSTTVCVCIYLTPWAAFLSDVVADGNDKRDNVLYFKKQQRTQSFHPQENPV